jgi:uncharacterized protein YbjT (DUF2867 family)
MHVVIAGGHGQVALRAERLLAAEGHSAIGLVRDPAHVADLERAGARGVVLDLEDADAGAVADAVRGADAVVFAAGAGPGSGPERKRTVDLGAAVALVEACRASGVGRYVMVSSIGAHDPASAGAAMRPYLEAKAEADAALAASGLAFTIVRPGSLTDDAGTGRVRVETQLGHRGPVPRDDVAAVLVACLATPATIGRTFEVFTGDTPIAEALARL